ncbi:unnamed protein product [Hydatigera taeniaeformis]|uniref:CLASP_N domain-containing protein n=1 Tax=Hydatigena taeniaeformis TaxID=6205 RepID=A0A0R3X5V1_HYDTA|nr:unnamed protein product [Hydatigera taeniaeformis]
MSSPRETDMICDELVGSLCSSEPEEIIKPPQRASSWRNAVRRNRQANLGYTDHFHALQELGKAKRSQPLFRTAAPNSAGGKKLQLTLVSGDNSHTSDPVGDAKSNSYTRISERRQLRYNEAQSRGRSLFVESSGDRRALKVMDSLEKTRSWAQQTQGLFSQKNLSQNSANNPTAVTSKESREALTRMSSGYASEDVNQVTSLNNQFEVLSTESNQNEKSEKSFSRKSTFSMSVNAIENQLPPRLRHSLQARLKRSRTVHWTGQVSCVPGVEIRGALEALTSREWENQHDALHFLNFFFRANLHAKRHNLGSWSLEQIQRLCSGLVFAASNLRSQVSRMAIGAIKSTVKLLTMEQLELVTRCLFFGLVSRVSGDASTTFLRNEACEAIDVLVERAPALLLLSCLNDACHSTPSRSLLGRRCLARCYAAVLHRILSPSNCPSKVVQHSLLTRKHQDIFNRMLPHLASFLRNGDSETRRTGEKVLRVLITIHDLEAHLKSVLDDRDRGTFAEAIGKLLKRKGISSMTRSFSTLGTPRRPTPSCVAHGRSGRRPFAKRASTPPLSSTHVHMHLNELAQRKCSNDSGQTAMLRLGGQERFFSLLKLGAQINDPAISIRLSTSEVVGLVLPMLRDANEEIVVAALKLCLDSRQLDSQNVHCDHDGDKFCPGLLSLLCEREDTEGFTNVLALIYHQLHSKFTGVSQLSRKCLNETRRILGAEALVKPLLKAIYLSTSDTVSLVHELCDITSDLDIGSPVITRHLIPAAVQMLHRCHPVTEVGRRQCKGADATEYAAVVTLIKCLANLAGIDALYIAATKEGLDSEVFHHLLVPV